MNRVKKEEEPSQTGFSATRLGMERSLEKQRSSMVAAVTASDQFKH